VAPDSKLDVRAASALLPERDDEPEVDEEDKGADQWVDLVEDSDTLLDEAEA